MMNNISGIKFHSKVATEVLEILNSSVDGLPEKEAMKRLEQYGPNVLPTREAPGLFKVFLMQFLHPLIYILLAAAVASLAIGEYVDAGFIMLVILLNSSLGAYQEWNAEKSASALQNLLRIRARVLRDGKEAELDSSVLVPGDIVLLESGNKVPADLRLLEARGLSVDESFLTGESIAAEKSTESIDQHSAVSDRVNMCFAGASVLSGRGIGVVTATGMATEVGKIAQDVSLATAAKPPLIIRMEKFTKQISYIVLSIAAILAGFLIFKGYGTDDVFFFVVALAVSAIPEGLPVALTVALSIATRRMSRRNVIVRKLSAVESLGSCTVIASDKTGTLTVNQQTVKLIELPDGLQCSVSGEGYNGKGDITPLQDTPEEATKHKTRLIINAMIANEGKLKKDGEEWTHHGDAMDIALLALGYKAGLSQDAVKESYPRVDTIPYESEKKFSGAYYDEHGKVMLAVKGATETILDFCDRMKTLEGTIPVDRKYVEARALELAAGGYRVLAVAEGEVDGFEKKEVYGNGDISEMTFLGLIAFIDPVRPEVMDAINKSREAGIRVLMITGDHPATAAAIGKELSIIADDNEVVSGLELEDALSEGKEQFVGLVLASRVFARVTPVQKKRIVEVLRENGEFVAVTGDGVNDAPALRAANIGVAMGSGTDVARETGSMIITDDNFSSIVTGVEEGRFAYDNVRKVILLLISTGAAEVILFLLAILANLPLPLLAVQLLWLNLVTNGIQDVALAFEGGEPGAMQRKPRKTNETVFNKLMIQQTFIAGITMGLIAFGTWYYLIEVAGMAEVSARNIILLLIVFMQNFHVFNCRSERVSAFRVPIRRNIPLVFGVLIAASIHIASMHLPFMQTVLRAEPMAFQDILTVFALAVPVILMMEIFKLIRRKFTGSQV
ncbi:MAG: HAD-IC family P-type ATPase [Bacteroidales bacterium]